MRQNLPVIDEEIFFLPGASLVSKTDLYGNITYANDAFVSISGYSREELIGKPHNLVRHPDMPVQVFSHLWLTLKQGNPWKGVVKNRAKDGRFYWVKAVIVPIRKEDQTIGYMSVREAVNPDEIESATSMYARLKQTGEPVRQNVLHNWMTIKTGFTLGSLFVILLMIAGGIVGIGGLRQSSTDAQSLYEDRIQPIARANRLDAGVHELRGSLAAWYMVNSQGVRDFHATTQQRDDFLERFKQAERETSLLLEKLQSDQLSEANRLILNRVRDQYSALLGKIIHPLARDIESDAPVPAINSQVGYYLPYFKDLQATLGELQQSIKVQAEQDYRTLEQRNELIWKIALTGIIIGTLIVVVVGRFFLKNIVTPLETAIRNFDRIAQGDLSGEVEVFGKGETGELIRASAVMQMHIKVIADEISLVAHGIHQHCKQLNEALFEISDHSEIQHDRLSEARNYLSMDFGEALSGSIEALQSQITRLNQPSSGEPDAAGLAVLQETVDQVANLVRLQTFAQEDFLQKIDQLSDLVMENRQETHEAYAMSERLQEVANHMNELVSYFSDQRAGRPRELA